MPSQTDRKRIARAIVLRIANRSQTDRKRIAYAETEAEAETELNYSCGWLPPNRSGTYARDEQRIGGNRMPTLTKSQAERLATYVCGMRRDWSHSGVMAAIQAAVKTTADGYDIARAINNLAADPTVKTPALLSKPGPWWRNPAGENVAPADGTMRCHDHPGQPASGCAECRATPKATDDTIATAMEEARAALAAGRAALRAKAERNRDR